MAYEQYPYHYVYDGKTGLTKETVTDKKNKTVVNNATTDAKNTTKPADEKKLNEKLTESFAQGEKNVTETNNEDDPKSVPVKGTVKETKNVTIVETSIGTKKVAEEEDKAHVHHYSRNPASVDDYYHIRDGHKIAYE